MKPLLPTLKEKKRYLVYIIDSEKELPRNVHHKVIKEVQNTLGLFDSARAGLLHMKYDPATHEGVLKASVQSINKVRAALTIITTIEQTPLRVTVTGMSGVLKKTERFSQQRVGLGGI